jgi:hypothetical protein
MERAGPIRAFVLADAADGRRQLQFFHPFLGFNI